MERNKGKSIISFPTNYIVLDIETTGLDPKFDEIIEISALKVENDIIVSKFETLIRPDQSINGFISSLTGINDRMVFNMPTIADVLPSFAEYIGNSIIVGHSVNFDINFLYDNFKRIYGVDFNNDYVDTVRIAKKLLKELDHHRLYDLKEYFNVYTENDHRANSDTLATFEIYLKLKNKIEDHDEFIKSFKYKRKRANKGFDFSAIKPQVEEFDDTHPVYNQNFAITGILSKFVRKDAVQQIVNLGGYYHDNMTKNTNYLVVGLTDYSKFAEGFKSSKLLKAEEYISKGLPIQIISENTFYDLLNEE